MRSAVLVLLALAAPTVSLGQVALSPAVVVAGLEAYEHSGANAALDQWLKGWAPADDSTARATLAPSLAQFEATSGKMIGYDLLGTATWGLHACRSYVVIRFEQRPLYARFDAYDGSIGWRVLNVTWHLDPAEVFPVPMLVPNRSLAPSASDSTFRGEINQ